MHTPIEQRGEQMLNREAKTTGGISKFAGNDDSVTKWTLNRSSQAKITAELKAITGVSRTEDKYKALHAYQIEKSEKWTSKLVQTIAQEFLNPFDDFLDQAKLYNLSSDIPIDTQKSEQMLKIKEDGSMIYEEFVVKSFLSEDLDFQDPLSRNKLELFKSCGRTVKKEGKLTSVEVNRNVIGTLLALSAKSEKLIDFETALSYPLCSVPLSLLSPDGCRRATQKSKLMEIILNNSETLESDQMPPKDSVIAYVVDLMALVRVQSNIPVTYEELSLQLFKSIPQGYKRVDIVADTYRQQSIKDPECMKRGCSERVIVQSAKSRIPRNFSQFLQNGNNKMCLIELVLTTKCV